jgi:ABC-type nitrate/sulfonate/bicarbonate transport system substrate-binding protein
MIHLFRALALVCSAALPALSFAQAAPDKLVALSAGNTTPLAPIYLAETLGYARQEGLDLTVKTVFANSLNLVVAGEGDLSVIGVSSALVPVREGKETSIVYAISSGLGTGFMAASPNVKSIADCTRVSTSRAGSAVFSSAMAYKTTGGGKFNILELGDANQIVPSVLSGGSDCAVSALAVLQPGLDRGLQLLVDPRNPATVPPNTIQNTISSGLWGMKANLNQKRPAMEKLMRALKRVEQFIKTATPEQVAAELIKHPDFKTFQADAIAKQVVGEKLFWFPDGGYIRNSAWPGTLAYYKYGLPFIDGANKLYSWEERVDMSYWITANGQPANR